MKRIIIIPSDLEKTLRKHLFQNELEQGAFLFTKVHRNQNELRLEAEDFYLVPEEGWQVQLEVYLEMKDSERAKIMALARKAGYAAIDCHSHPGSNGEVDFSPSDRYGITDFAAYAKWKLDGKPFAATVWGEESLDAVVWMGDFKGALPVDEVRIHGSRVVSIKPRGTWFMFMKKSKPWWRRG